MSEAGTQAQVDTSPGNFCWAELATTDGPAAKKFYGDLFGWDGNDMPIGPSMVYTMLKLNGKDAGALYQKGDDMKEVPTVWFTYVSVASADETAAKAKSLGATIMKEPFDVFTVGRMAVITDPTGAVFCIWQAGTSAGFGIKNQTNSACWFELLTNDTDKAADFYSKLFGWTPKTHGPEMSSYTEWYLGDTAIGGMMQIQPHMGPMPPNWGIYFAVDDVDGSAKKAESLGGKICVPPMDIPNVGRFSVIADPQGGPFSIIKLSTQHHENKS